MSVGTPSRNFSTIEGIRMTGFADARALSATIGTLRAAGCVFAEEEAALLHSAATSQDELASMVSRRVAGLPLEHILG